MLHPADGGSIICGGLRSPDVRVGGVSGVLIATPVGAAAVAWAIGAAVACSTLAAAMVAAKCSLNLPGERPGEESLTVVAPPAAAAAPAAAVAAAAV